MFIVHGFFFILDYVTNLIWLSALYVFILVTGQSVVGREGSQAKVSPPSEAFIQIKGNDSFLQ